MDNFCSSLAPHLNGNKLPAPRVAAPRGMSDSREAVHVPSESRKAFFEKQKMLLGTFNIYLIITTPKLPTTRACAVNGTRGYG